MQLYKKGKQETRFIATSSRQSLTSMLSLRYQTGSVGGDNVYFDLQWVSVEGRQHPLIGIPPFAPR